MVMHTVVEQPVTKSLTGRIVCHAAGRHPIAFDWVGPTTATVVTSDDGSEALDVGPGNYRVTATDADGECAEQAVHVAPVAHAAVCITGYRTTAASSSVARDGAVEAIGDGLGAWRFAWTNGVTTTGPILHDVPTGTYAALPVPDPDHPAPTVVHTGAPGHVGVRP